MADYTQAEQTAERLLHIGSLTYRQISQITELPVWHVKSLAQDVIFARNSNLRYMRHVLFLMKRASTDTPPKMIETFTRWMERTQKLLFNRDTTEREIAELTDYAVNLDVEKLQELLTQLHLFSNLPDMQLIASMQTFTDSIYAQILRDEYDIDHKSLKEDSDDEMMDDDSIQEVSGVSENSEDSEGTEIEKSDKRFEV